MTFKVALAQLDTRLADVDFNLIEVAANIRLATEQGAELIVFPELSLQGYALDTVTDDVSINIADKRIKDLSSDRCDVLVGFQEASVLARYNSAAYLSRGHILNVHRKVFFPGSTEFSFSSPGDTIRAFDTRLARMATLVCYDAWQVVAPWLAVQDGAEVILIPANSVSNLDLDGVDMAEFWSEILVSIARFQQCWVVFVNRVGTEEGREFWGGSRVVDPSGMVVAEASRTQSDLLITDIDVCEVRRRRFRVPLVNSPRLGLIEREVSRLNRRHFE